MNKGTDPFKGMSQVVIGGGGTPYPCQADGGLYVSPIFLGETQSPLTASVPRGELPGVYSPLHAKPLTNEDVWVPTGDLSGKTFEAVNNNGSAQILFEISDTW